MERANFMQGAGLIVIMCLVVLAIVFFKGRMHLIFGFALRGLCGVVGIYVINMLMERAAYEASIGVNPVTVLAATILGFPGLAALYGIKIVSLL